MKVTCTKKMVLHELEAPLYNGDVDNNNGDDEATHYLKKVRHFLTSTFSLALCVYCLVFYYTFRCIHFLWVNNGK